MGFALNFLPPAPPIPTLHFLDAFRKEKEDGEKYLVWQLKFSRNFIFKAKYRGDAQRVTFGSELVTAPSSQIRLKD